MTEYLSIIIDAHPVLKEREKLRRLLLSLSVPSRLTLLTNPQVLEYTEACFKPEYTKLIKLYEELKILSKDLGTSYCNKMKAYLEKKTEFVPSLGKSRSIDDLIKLIKLRTSLEETLKRHLYICRKFRFFN